MRRLLVTGGAGFIGANFVHHWLGEHPRDRLVVIDALTYAGNPANLAPATDNPAFRFERGDIRDLEAIEALLRDEEIDTIVHFAAESHVDRSIVDPGAFVDVNVKGTHALLEAARRVWLSATAGRGHRFHHVSTDEVYGSLELSEIPSNEVSRYRPNSPYAASKAAADHLVRAYHRTYGLETTISNACNNYGPYQFPEKLIPLAIVNLLEGRPIPIYGRGTNVREWILASDHCRGIELVLERGEVGETYNLGSGAGLNNLELIRRLCAQIDRLFAERPALGERFGDSLAARGDRSEKAIQFVPDRPGHDLRYAIDSGKAERELGYSAPTGIDAGLVRTVAWYVDNEEWWRAILAGSYRDWVASQYGL